MGLSKEELAKKKAEEKAEVVKVWNEYLGKDGLDEFKDVLSTDKKQQGIRISSLLMDFIVEGWEDYNRMRRKQGHPRVALGLFMELLMAKSLNLAIKDEILYMKYGGRLSTFINNKEETDKEENTNS